MPPPIALVLTLTFVAYCLRQDLRDTEEEAGGLWFPSMFLVLLCSRPLSAWLNPQAAATMLDTTVNVFFAFGSLLLVSRRGFRWEEGSITPILILFLGYCGLSLVWSEVAFHSLKQYIKLLGMGLTAFLVASESDPGLALARVVRRCAYVLIPVSYLFIKYYPHLGVSFDYWSGSPAYFGVTDGKNMLGQLCMVVMLVLIPSLSRRGNGEFSDRAKRRVRLDACLIILAAYLLFAYVNSATSTVCVALGITWMVLLRRPVVSRHVGLWLVVVVVGIVVAQVTFELSASLAALFGRDPTLTNRTLIWKEALAVADSVWLGAGYEAFWSTRRITFVVNEAHNGLLEIYLNLGTVGMVLFCLVLVSTFSKCRSALPRQDSLSRVALPLWITGFAYNLTEAGWKGMNVAMFILLYMAVLPVLRSKKNAGDLASAGPRVGIADGWASGKSPNPRAAPIQAFTRVAGNT